MNEDSRLAPTTAAVTATSESVVILAITITADHRRMPGCVVAAKTCIR